MKTNAILGIVFATVAGIVRPVGAEALAATTITFGNVCHDIGNRGPFTESTYRYNAVGTSWSIQKDFPRIDPFVLDSPALTTFWGIPSAVGNTVSFTRLDGGTFYFRSVDILGRLPGQTNDVVQAQGLLNGAEVAALTLQSSLQAFTTVQSGPMFDMPIDTLQFKVTQINNSSLVMDNVVFSQVPEPALVSLIAVPALGLLMRRSRNNYRGDHSHTGP